MVGRDVCQRKGKFVSMLEFFRKLLTGDFMPHRVCYLENAGVLWLNVGSDLAITLAYYLIPVVLFYFTRRRRDITFNWIFVAFGVFILACGTTHLVGAITVWNPVYRLDGLIKALTAVASMVTLLMLIPMLPMLISLPSPSTLARINQDLAAQIEERRAAEEKIRQINQQLESHVENRTSALAQSEAQYRRLAEEQGRAKENLEKTLGELKQEMQRRRELEGQLIQSQKMEAVGRLAGGVAHDFNNLLTVILGYNDMLQEEMKDHPVASEFVQEVHVAAERASALTNQLLAFSRRQVSAPQVVDLNQIVRGMDRMLGRIIGEDVRLEIRLATDLAPVQVDPSHMDQVILNLAVNSRDAMPDGGTLTIETANVNYLTPHNTLPGLPAGPVVVLSVTDTGVGMDAQTKSRVFEPFFTTKEKGKGTGLGLAIVYGVVKQNGGEIFCDSQPGQGAAFRIYLPACVESPAPSGNEKREIHDTASGQTVLIVEDEDQVRSIARSMLIRRGYRVLDANSAPEALTILRDPSQRIDLLLTDIVMPLMSGVALAEEARDVRPGLRVLFMSGYSEESKIQTKALSEIPFLHKPFTAQALEEKVREAMVS
jgi:signal transduction histidine kinase